MAAPALPYWAAKSVAQYVASHRELLTQMEDDELIEFLKGVPWRDRDRAANRGTEVHNLAARLARNEEVEVPEELVGHVDSYLKFLREWKPQNERIERPCFSRQWRYGGTFDNLCTIPLLGKWCLLDYKTSRSGVWPETGLQLAAYGMAEFYVGSRGGEFEMPQIDFYGCLWIRADGYSLIPFKVTERDCKNFIYIRHLAWWLEYRKKEIMGEELWHEKSASALGEVDDGIEG